MKSRLSVQLPFRNTCTSVLLLSFLCLGLIRSSVLSQEAPAGKLDFPGEFFDGKMPDELKAIADPVITKAWKRYSRDIDEYKKELIGRLRRAAKNRSNKRTAEQVETIENALQRISDPHETEVDTTFSARDAESARKTYARKLQQAWERLFQVIETLMQAKQQSNETGTRDKLKLAIQRVRYPQGHVFGGNYYVVFEKTKRAWKDARDHCKELGGHLICCETEKEIKFAAGLIPKELGQGDESAIWLGASDEAKEGKWMWVTGSQVAHGNWHKGSPRNKKGNEDYLAYTRWPESYSWGSPMKNRWEDRSGTTKFMYVCEWELGLRDKEDSPDEEELEWFSLLEMPPVREEGSDWFKHFRTFKHDVEVNQVEFLHSEIIQAHAPGRLEYEFPEPVDELSCHIGLWDTATGGNVKFRVLADGKEVFASEGIGKGVMEDIQLGFSPARSIVLITEPNGPDRADHSLWIRPKVHVSLEQVPIDPDGLEKQEN